MEVLDVVIDFYNLHSYNGGTKYCWKCEKSFIVNDKVKKVIHIGIAKIYTYYFHEGCFDEELVEKLTRRSQ